MSRHRAIRTNHRPHLEERCFVHYAPAAVRSVPAAVRDTLKVVGGLSIITFCANITPTLLWLLPPLLPSWLVITRRSSWVALLGLESLLIATGRLVTLVSTARVGWGLVEGLDGVWLARLLVVWPAIRCGVRRWWVVTTRGRGWR